MGKNRKRRRESVEERREKGKQKEQELQHNSEEAEQSCLNVYDQELLKLNLLEYSSSHGLLNEEQYNLGLEMRAAFRRQRDFNIGLDYSRIRTKGGKFRSHERMREILASRSRWRMFGDLLGNRSLEEFLEETVGVEKTAEQWLKDLGLEGFYRLNICFFGVMESLRESMEGENRETLRKLKETADSIGRRELARRLRLSNRKMLDKILEGSLEYPHSLHLKIKRFLRAQIH
jgi:hypothetical protein